MKNDSTRGGRKISIPPSLLFSVIAKCPDISRAVTSDAKKAGDYVYILGDTKPELGGSEYYHMLGFTGNAVPTVDAAVNLALYRKVEALVKAGLAASLAVPGPGGLGMALARTAMGGRLGMKIDLDAVPASKKCSSLEKLFSESSGRFVATVSPEKAASFEEVLAGSTFAKIGTVTADGELLFTGHDSGVVGVGLDELIRNYKETLDQV